MASLVATVLFFGLIGMSIAMPLARKLPAWGALLIANGAIHLIAFVDPSLATTFWYDQQNLEALKPIAAVQFFTSMFLHGDFMHLFGNMLILGFVGYHLEERLGARTFLFVYLLTGLGGNATTAIVEWGEPLHALGASGAIFGVLGVLGAAYPQDRVLLPIPIGIIIFQRIKGWVAAAIGGVMQYLILIINPVGIGIWAHLGGLGTGLIVGAILGRRKPKKQDAAPQDVSRFAATTRAKHLVARLEESKDVPDVHAAWMERFVREAQCPVCGKQPAMGKHGLACPDGH